jgi:cytosine deaminase
MRALQKQLSKGLTVALTEAERSFEQGGIPIGAALCDARGDVVARGHNQRIQRGSQILHAEIDCLANAGRRHDYAGTVLYSTLMPCYMCAGAIVQFGIPKVVVGESRNFGGARDLLEGHGVEVDDLDSDECADLLKRFIESSPDIWYEDIGE